MSWILKRNDNGQTIDLHRQYMWSDEYDWSETAQSNPVYMFSGAMDIQQGTKKAGRPITLDCTHARITRGDVKTLQAWSNIPELQMTLTHPDGRTFNVAFRRPFIDQIKVIIDLRPEDQSDSDKMTANIHLMTV